MTGGGKWHRSASEMLTFWLLPFFEMTRDDALMIGVLRLACMTRLFTELKKYSSTGYNHIQARVRDGFDFSLRPLY
jgi:hypothetical protein